MYETEREKNNELISSLETKIDFLQQEIDDLRSGNVNARPQIVLKPGQINAKNAQKVRHICDTIRVANSLTANAFNTLLALTVNNKDSPPASVTAWRMHFMAAYATNLLQSYSL